MKTKNLLFAVGLLCIFAHVPLKAQSLTDTIFDRYANEDFAYGADISWGGSNLKDKNGVPKDLLTILKDQGLNSVRYRVWYPANGPSGKNEVVRNAKAAHDRGFKVMIDFHYSDSWADPGKQFIPSAWEGHTTEQLVQDVYDHTYDVLKALKDVGVTPAWVQIGNETKRGMLWPNGNSKDTPNGMNNFARMINGGYDAVKAIDSTIQAIVHLPDADENNLYRSMFDGLKKNGAKWDIIGMSAYPHWAHLDWKTEIDMSVANMKDMIQRYDTKVMVVETGYDWEKPYEANNFMVELMDTMMTFGGLGCFWWEPQSMFGYALTAWDPATRQPTLAMDAYLGIKHTDPATVIHINLLQPQSGTTFREDENITLSASATHRQGEIAKVSFYVNNKIVSTLTEAPYTFELPNPGVGNYSIFASATDTNGIVVKTESISVLVGLMQVFQENAAGYCGITDNAGTIDSNNANYTGDGFINTDNETGVTVNWTVDFVEAGSYIIDFRYAATSTRPASIKIKGKVIGSLSFTSTGAWDTWQFSSINYTVTEPGPVPISITATGADGLPNIDYLNIKSVGNATKPKAASECLDNSNPSTGTISTEVINNISVHPTTTKHEIIIESPALIESISIYNMSGTMVKKLNNVRTTQVVVPCQNFNQGMYIVQALVDNNLYTQKFNF